MAYFFSDNFSQKAEEISSLTSISTYLYVQQDPHKKEIPYQKEKKLLKEGQRGLHVTFVLHPPPDGSCLSTVCVCLRGGGGQVIWTLPPSHLWSFLLIRQAD